MQHLRPVSLFNTLTRQIEPLNPVCSGEIGIYCCGPTVYSYAHLGNLKTYLWEDALVRMLRFAGYKVKHVMNITDVGHLTSDSDQGEDKMALAARREKKRSFEIAEFYTSKFFADCDKLHIRKPDVICKATEYVPQMIELIRRIEANGYTYVANGNVYFDVSKFPGYGKLARLDLEQLQAGARIEVDQAKKNPFDFVLWFTRSKFENQELIWDSPWGRGYPGWHIECSAMSMDVLGESIDIHCGGVDHIPVHHTNEIAQSEAATGKPWVRLWMHGAFMQMNAEKMSKSVGNLLLVDDIIERKLDPLAYRYLALGSHYRSQLNFTWEAAENANNALIKLKNGILALKAKAPGGPAAALDEKAQHYLEEFAAAVCDDLNTPRAMTTVSAVASAELAPEQKLAVLYRLDEVLGFGMREWQEEQVEVSDELKQLLAGRQKARAEKNWSEADKIREKIAALGFAVKDSAEGPKLQKLMK